MPVGLELWHYDACPLCGLSLDDEDLCKRHGAVEPRATVFWELDCGIPDTVEEEWL